MVAGITTPYAQSRSRIIDLNNYIWKYYGQMDMGEDKAKQILESLPNDYWDFVEADTQEFTHGLHTYPATMICPISRNIIKLMQGVYEIHTLMDPFSGSGTVLVEGMLAGIEEIHGNDINPLAIFMSKVKTTPIDERELKLSINELKSNLDSEFFTKSSKIKQIDEKICSEVDVTGKDGWGDRAEDYLQKYLPEEWGLTIKPFKNMGYWVKPKVLIELLVVKKTIESVKDQKIRNFALTAYSEIIRIVSNRRNGEFKMYRMDAEKVQTFNPDVLKEFNKVLDRNVQKMNAFTDKLQKNYDPTIKIHSDNAMILDSIPDNSVDIVITSPPYGDSRTTVAYGEFSKLSLNFLTDVISSTIDINKIDKNLMGGTKYEIKNDLSSSSLYESLEIINNIDPKRAIDVYSFYKDLEQSISAIANKSKSGTYQFWVVGNRTVKKELLRTDKIIAEMGSKYNMSHVITLERRISNKVMPSANSPSNIAGETVTTMNNEHIVVLRKN